MSDTARLISPEKRGEDVDVALRPQTLDDFTGQKAARANLKVFIEAARAMPKNLTINLNSAQVLMLLMKSNGCRPEWLGQTSEYLRRAEAAAPSDARYLRLKQMYQGLRQSSEQAA